MTDVHPAAVEIHDQFAEQTSLTVKEVEGRLDTFVNEYQVPLEEARQTIVNHYRDETEPDYDEVRANNEQRDLVEITAADEWIDITAKVVDLWEPRSDAIAQVGLLGDETGRIKFTSWAKSDLQPIEEGAVYHFGNVVTDEYQGQYSVKLNRTTTIEEADEEFEVGDNTVEVEGALVAIQSGSGLIKRCPTEDCTRVLQNGRCSEHGEVEGEFDLRIKGVLDSGHAVQDVTLFCSTAELRDTRPSILQTNRIRRVAAVSHARLLIVSMLFRSTTEERDVIFNREMTEDLTGITLAEAKDRAMDALDTTVVADDIRADTLGQYYHIEGPALGRYVLVNEYDQLGPREDGDEVLIKARSL